MDNMITSNTQTSYKPQIDIENIDKYIEENVEKKINQVLDILPQATDVKTPKMIYEYTIAELYTGTIQTVVDIINDMTTLMAERKYITSKAYRERLINIFFQQDRKIFVGIVFVLVSFILYFVDGADA